MGGSLGTTMAMWEPQLPGLAATHRVLRFEHRGHGGSPVPNGPYSIDALGQDVLAMMDRLGLQRASYCGLSIGGMVGQWLAINAPERIEQLILICTSAYLPPAEGWHDRAATVRAAGTPEAVADAVLTRWFTPSFAESPSRRAGALPGDDLVRSRPKGTPAAARRSPPWICGRGCRGSPLPHS